jgi:hypothetical protein
MNIRLYLMIYSHFMHRISNVCALVAATLILPALAYADRDDGKRTQGDNDDRWSQRDEHRWGDKQYVRDKNEHSWGEKDTTRNREDVPVVPEANAAWVLVPFFGAVLLYSWRQFSRSKA